MTAGDLIFWHGRNSIALVIQLTPEKNWCHENLWVCLLEDGIIISDDLSDGYTVIDENWNWPEWHVNNKENFFWVMDPQTMIEADIEVISESW